MPVQPASPERLALVQELAVLQQGSGQGRDRIRAGLLAMLDRMEPHILAAVNGLPGVSERARRQARRELEAQRRDRQVILARLEGPGPGPRPGGGR